MTTMIASASFGPATIAPASFGPASFAPARTAPVTFTPAGPRTAPVTSASVAQETRRRGPVAAVGGGLATAARFAGHFVVAFASVAVVGAETEY